MSQWEVNDRSATSGSIRVPSGQVFRIERKRGPAGLTTYRLGELLAPGWRDGDSSFCMPVIRRFSQDVPREVEPGHAQTVLCAAEDAVELDQQLALGAIRQPAQRASPQLDRLGRDRLDRAPGVNKTLPGDNSS